MAKIPWLETTYGSRWPNDTSSRRYQIWQMECPHCDFKIDPARFRRYDEERANHPAPYGNLASISHARKIMREHFEHEHAAPETQ